MILGHFLEIASITPANLVDYDYLSHLYLNSLLHIQSSRDSAKKGNVIHHNRDSSPHGA
jgi:hypothetical protein